MSRERREQLARVRDEALLRWCPEVGVTRSGLLAAMRSVPGCPIRPEEYAEEWRWSSWHPLSESARIEEVKRGEREAHRRASERTSQERAPTHR